VAEHTGGPLLGKKKKKKKKGPGEIERVATSWGSGGGKAGNGEGNSSPGGVVPWIPKVKNWWLYVWGE